MALSQWSRIRTGLLLAAALAAGCGTPPAPAPTLATTPVRPTPSPIDSPLRTADGGASVRYQLPVRPAEQIADGSTLLINAGTVPIRLETIEPVYAAEPPPGVLLGVHLVTDPGTDRPVGITRDYPPPVRLGAVPGAVLAPVGEHGDRYQVILGLRVRTGTVAVTGLRVTFTMNGTTLVQVVPHFVRLCSGRPAGSTDC